MKIRPAKSLGFLHGFLIEKDFFNSLLVWRVIGSCNKSCTLQMWSMRTGRPLKPLTLPPEERAGLELMARRPKTDQRAARRARIVLDCADGPGNAAVAAKRGVTLQTAGKWRERFLTGRMEASGGAPRSGQPRKLTDAQVGAVIARTLETRPRNAIRWSARAMAEASGLNQNAIVRVWRAFGLKPRLQENFKLSTDAFFVEKERDIAGLCLNPPGRTRAVALCVEEKSHVRASAKFKLTGSMSVPLIVRGEVSGGKTSFTLWGTNLAPAGPISYFTMYPDNPLEAERVDFYDPMRIQWKYSSKSKLDFLDAGVSANPVYVSWGPPATANLFRTVADAACRGAKGMTVESNIVAGVWGDFEGPIPGVKRHGGTPMTYYLNTAQPYLTPGDLRGLLLYSDGRCGAWAQLFSSAVALHGIATSGVNVFVNTSFVPQATAAYIALYGRDPGYDNYIARDVFFVKHWDLTSSNRWNAIDKTGVSGQGNKNPISVFEDHALVRIGTKLYDPSYGTGPYATLQEWEDASVDGYGVQFIKTPGALSADFKFWIGKEDTKGVLEVVE